MSMSGVSGVAVSAMGMSTGSAATQGVGADAASTGRMAHLAHTLQGFSSTEIMSAMMQSVHHTHHHHPVGDASAAVSAAVLSIGAQVTGSHTGYASAAAATCSVGAQISVHG